RPQRGQRAAAPYQGPLPADARAWGAFSKQPGAVLVDGLVDFLSVLAAFQAEPARPPRPSGRVVLFGNGGGISVIAADTLARAGPNMAPVGREALAKPTGLALPAGGRPAHPPAVATQV